MTSQLGIWLVISGFAYAYGNDCESSQVRTCYYLSIYYETRALPNYGLNEEELNGTCLNIGTAFGCILHYHKMCTYSPECGDNCKRQLADINLYSSVSSLSKLVNELCTESSTVKQIYLENAACLKENEALYATCHADSLRSKVYLSTIAATQEDNCCYASWFKDCFVNITRDKCGENATFFVLFAVNKLRSKYGDQSCFDSTCTSPPLPPDKINITTEEIDITTAEIDLTTAEIDLTTAEIDITTGEIDVTTEETAFTTAKIDLTTEDDMKDKEIAKKQEGPKGAATIKYCTGNTVVLSFLYILLSKYYVP